MAVSVIRCFAFVCVMRSCLGEPSYLFFCFFLELLWYTFIACLFFYSPMARLS